MTIWQRPFRGNGERDLATFWGPRGQENALRGSNPDTADCRLSLQCPQGRTESEGFEHVWLDSWREGPQGRTTAGADSTPDSKISGPPSPCRFAKAVHVYLGYGDDGSHFHEQTLHRDINHKKPRFTAHLATPTTHRRPCSYTTLTEYEQNVHRIHFETRIYHKPIENSRGYQRLACPKLVHLDRVRHNELIHPSGSTYCGQLALFSPGPEGYTAVTVTVRLVPPSPCARLQPRRASA